MKKLILTMATLFMANTVLASPTQIGKVDAVSTYLMQAKEKLECLTYDANQDGIMDDVVSLNPGAGYSPGLTVSFLSINSIRNEFLGANGAMCAIVKKIVEQSFQNFTAFNVEMSSELLLGRTQIIENVELKIDNITPIQNTGGAPVSITLKTQISKKLNVNEPSDLFPQD